jgi:acyl carrier protein
MAHSGPHPCWTGCADFPAKLRALHLLKVDPQMEGDFHQMTIEPAKEPVVAREETEVGLSPLPPGRSKVDLYLREILRDVLALDPEQVDGFDADTRLFGHLPELDSMAVASLFTEMEDRLDIIIEDDDVDGEMLETYGGLLTFAEGKTATEDTPKDGSS